MESKSDPPPAIDVGGPHGQNDALAGAIFGLLTVLMFAAWIIATRFAASSQIRAFRYCLCALSVCERTILLPFVLRKRIADTPGRTVAQLVDGLRRRASLPVGQRDRYALRPGFRSRCSDGWVNAHLRRPVLCICRRRAVWNSPCSPDSSPSLSACVVFISHGRDLACNLAPGLALRFPFRRCALGLLHSGIPPIRHWSVACSSYHQLLLTGVGRSDLLCAIRSRLPESCLE